MFHNNNEKRLIVEEPEKILFFKIILLEASWKREILAQERSPFEGPKGPGIKGQQQIKCLMVESHRGEALKLLIMLVNGKNF